MKTWITYPAAIIFGLASTLLLQDWQPYVDFLGTVEPIARQLGLFVLFPVVFSLFTAAVASLRRYKETVIVFSSAIFWGLVSALLLSFIGMGLAIVLPFRFSPISGAETVLPEFFDFSSFYRMFIAENAFNQFSLTTTSLLPLIVLSLVFGIALRPDREAIRPAYVVVNSFAEAMMRLARIFTALGAALVLVISAKWFLDFPMFPLSQGNLWFGLGLLIAVLVAVLLVLPLLFGLSTLFRGGNPYKILLGSLGALLAGGFSGSLLFATTPLLAMNQHNCGGHKRVVGIATPLLTIFGRGGSAMVASYSIIMILSGTGTNLSFQTMIFIALFSALFSFASAFTPGLEVVFIIVFSMGGITGDGMSILQTGIMVLLPSLQMAGLVTDVAVNTFGTTFGSRVVSPDDRVTIEDMM
jgi:Na+/H+-dicarboxylate symporter